MSENSPLNDDEVAVALQGTPERRLLRPACRHGQVGLSYSVVHRRSSRLMNGLSAVQWFGARHC
jgi:hypothetical protein